MKRLENILLVSGSSRNCGKTIVACHAIKHLSATGKVYGLKITPHNHVTGSKQQLVCDEDGYRIYKELDWQSDKDTSRMLYAGATEVYFIQCTDARLKRAFKHLAHRITRNAPVVCESGSLANVYHPGLHLLIKGAKVDETKESYRANLKKADLVLTQSDFSPSCFSYALYFTQGKWTIKKKLYDQHKRSA